MFKLSIVHKSRFCIFGKHEFSVKRCKTVFGYFTRNVYICQRNGKTRLLQIKYKYFSDKVLELWRLCFAFFDESRQVFINTEQKEYLLVKNFYIVFEAIIDELIGDEVKQTYYIGDSKYYKIGHELTIESIYKQYSYARNVIQWNLDIFNVGGETKSGVRFRAESRRSAACRC